MDDLGLATSIDGECSWGAYKYQKWPIIGWSRWQPYSIVADENVRTALYVQANENSVPR